MKLPAEQGSEFFKCKRCNKFFISKKYLQKHYKRAHPDVDFYQDYKTEADFEKHPNPHILQPQPQVQAQSSGPSTNEL